MHELPHRLAIPLLLPSGAITGFVPALVRAPVDSAAFVPSWRLPAVVAAIISKSAFLVIWATVPGLVPPFPGAVALEGALLLLLLAATAVFAREAWQEARWNGMLSLRSET
jgi:hypothetical protein